MTPVKETKEYNRIFRKVLFQVLIDPTRGKLFKDLCDARGEKASAVLRSLAYQYAEAHADGEDYKLSLMDKKMKNYKPGEYTIQEHVKQCGHLMNLPLHDYLMHLPNRTYKKECKV